MDKMKVKCYYNGKVQNKQKTTKCSITTMLLYLIVDNKQVCVESYTEMDLCKGTTNGKLQ